MQDDDGIGLERSLAASPFSFDGRRPVGPRTLDDESRHQSTVSGRPLRRLATGRRITAALGARQPLAGPRP